MPFYQAMFADAGFPEAAQTEGWSDRMLDAVVLSGSEERVAERIEQLFAFGAGEIIAHIVPAGPDPAASRERSVALLSELAHA